MNALLKNMAQNKHTSTAAVIGFLCQAVPIFLPQYKAQCDQLFALAIIYGFTRASDAPPPPPAPAEDKRQRKLPLPLLLCGSLVGLWLCSGCMSTGSLVRALAKDPAVVSAEAVTPWGHVRVTRVGAQTNSVSITPASAEVNQ